MNIPFVDLKAQYLSIKQNIDEAIASVISEASFINGSHVKKFEKEWAEYLNIQYCIPCANGTDSIEILLKAMGIGAGDEVIVPAISWISTSEAVSNVGATPVFVDVDPVYYTIDETLIEEKITSCTKAIIPVHLYGQAAHMPSIMHIAQLHNLRVLEDCAQAHNAEINNKKVGTWGDCASFSFYPGKNLGAYGDAGCMVTDNEDIALKARMIANHGQLRKHEHQIEGRNSRLDGLQAAILSAKLPYLNKWTESRIQLANAYSQMIKGEQYFLPVTRPNSKHVFHLYVIRTTRRDQIISVLKEKGIETAIHYPAALPFLPAYNHYNYSHTDFPVAAAYQAQILSLPLFPEMSEHMIQYVSESLNHIFHVEHQ
jgi:dTDP-4-amino-4,6-dideoxygalactose transaminase